MSRRANPEIKKLRWIYFDAKYRCTKETHKRYADYGGRGIKFLFNSFEEWFEHMGPRPEGFEMDRIDNNGNYEKGNLRWVDFSTQQKNKRIYSNNTSGLKGVSFYSRDGVWSARYNFTKDGSRVFLYRGNDFFEACCARKSAEVKYD